MAHIMKSQILYMINIWRVNGAEFKHEEEEQMFIFRLGCCGATSRCVV